MAAKRRAKCNNQQKKAASMDGRWDGTRERRGVQGGHDSIILGVNEMKGGGGTKVKSINLFNYIISQPI